MGDVKVSRRTISERSELIHDVHEYGINPDSRAIFLHSNMHDEEEAGVDFRMASQFIKNLNFLAHINQKPILVHSITDGGCWYYGMGIYDAINTCKCQITILIHSFASSMSSIILQAADYRVMMSNSLFMIHEGGASIDSTTKGFLTAAEEEKKNMKVMLDIYAAKCKDGEKWKDKTINFIKGQLQKKMDLKQEWYLTPREAIKYGFADAVLGDEGYENIESLISEE